MWLNVFSLLQVIQNITFHSCWVCAEHAIYENPKNQPTHRLECKKKLWVCKIWCACPKVQHKLAHLWSQQPFKCVYMCVCAYAFIFKSYKTKYLLLPKNNPNNIKNFIERYTCASYIYVCITRTTIYLYAFIFNFSQFTFSRPL